MIVGTAGHIDHGKTTILKALTGTDADRLPEEKARGITVDLGFAYQHFPDQPSISFLDVPGHEKLVHNMLAGAIGIDFVVLVVAADDGPMPQTREHLAILDLVGVSQGVVALTKTDRVGAARVREVEAAIRPLLAPTTLADAVIIPCSAETGEGIEALAAMLKQAAGTVSVRPGQRRFRLAVDRVFSLTGVGLIVTGTVYAGTVKAGDVLLHSPSGLEVRVRGIRSENRSAEIGTAGQRCALNLTGRRVEKDAIARGDWIVAPEIHAPTERFDVRLRLQPHQARELKHWTRLHVHLGASDVTGRVALLEDKALEPGATALAQLVLDQKINALTSDRFIIRDQSATRTMGGGRVLDPWPPRRGARKPERLRYLNAMDRGSAGDALDALVNAPDEGADRIVDLTHFRRAWNLTGEAADALFSGSNVVAVEAGNTVVGMARQRWAALKDEIVAVIEDHQRIHPDSPGARADDIMRAFRAPALKATVRHVLRELTDAGIVLRFGQLFHLPGHEIKLQQAEELIWEEARGIMAAAAFDQPRVTALAETLGLAPEELQPVLNKLSRIGWLERVSKAYFMLPETLGRLASEAERVAASHPQKLLTVGNFREATGVNRHMAHPVLEYFDRAGFTRRVKAGRVLRAAWVDIAGRAL